MQTGRTAVEDWSRGRRIIMKTRKVRVWFLIYSILFSISSFFAVKNNFDNHYPILFSCWSILIYISACAGNFFYSFSFSNKIIQEYWRVVFSLFVFHFALFNIVDSLHMSRKQDYTIGANLIGVLIVFIIFAPSFRANYRLSFNQL